jgi:hypothetical protein
MGTSYLWLLDIEPNHVLRRDVWKNLLLPSPNKSIPRIWASQTFLCLTNFIEKSNSIYGIKGAPYTNIFYNKSNDTNLVT